MNLLRHFSQSTTTRLVLVLAVSTLAQRAPAQPPTPTHFQGAGNATQSRQRPQQRRDDATRLRLQKSLAQARAALHKNDLAAMQTPLEQALHIVRAQAPLQLDKLTVLQQPPQGLGMFSKSPHGDVHDGKLLLYVELRNFVSKPTKDKKWIVDLRSDAAFYYADGSFIARKNNIGRHRFVASTRHQVTFMVVELNLHGMPPQPYQVELIVHDANSGKTAQKSCNFTIVQP